MISGKHNVDAIFARLANGGGVVLHPRIGGKVKVCIFDKNRTASGDLESRTNRT